MAQKQQGIVQLNNLKLDDARVEIGSRPTGFSSVFAHTTRFPLIRLLEFTITQKSLTLTDGGANGAIYTTPLFTFPSSRVVILPGFIDIQIHSVGSNIQNDATIQVGLGSGAATVGSLTGTAIDFLTAVLQFDLVAGAGTGEQVGPIVFTHKDAAASTIKCYFNIGIPTDGDISDDEVMVVSATCRILFIDLSMGD